MVTIDMSLKNAQLYAGCSITSVAGRDNLATPVEEALAIVGRNIRDLIFDIPAEERKEITLTGPMAVWSYLVVFHSVVHSFGRVHYNDGRNPSVLVAAHGC